MTRYRTIGDLMQTEIITISTSASLADLETLLTSYGITGALVLDDREEPAGVASQGDIMRYRRQRLERALFDDDFGGTPSWKKARGRPTVADIMTPVLLSLSSDSPPSAAARLMLKEGVHRIFVTRERKVVGIVTPMDMLKMVAELK